MPTKLTNKDIDQKLKNTNFKRIGNYVGIRVKIEFQCLICGHIKTTTPCAVITGKRGCPKCSGRLKITNDIIDERLARSTIKRIGDYSKYGIKIDFECLICTYVWKARPNHIVEHRSACPKCSGNLPLTNEIIDERLDIRGIKRLNDFSRSHDYMNFQCLKCLYCWETKAYQVISNGKGCPKCGGTCKLSNEIIDERLKDRQIKRLEDYINSITTISFKCLKCNGIWNSRPQNVISHYTGCPKCSHSSISQSEIEWLDYLKVPKEFRQKRININGRFYNVDAFNKITNTIYEFYGDYWHGNPEVFNPNAVNKNIKKRFKTLYNDTMQRERKIKEAGFIIFSIWENDWNKLKNNG